MGEHGDNLEGNVGALFKPNRSDWEKFMTTMELALSFVEPAPGLSVAIKAAAWGRAWFLDGKKADRVTPVLVGLYDRLQTLEADQKDYIRKDEAQVMSAAVEEALRRIADQPDDGRRQEMRRILFKILDKPRDLAENRLFIRLADELPVPALKLLNATGGKVADIVSTQKGLCQLTDLSEYDATFWLKFLVSQGLIDDEKLGIVHHTTYEAALTPLGRLFEEYRRG